MVRISAEKAKAAANEFRDTDVRLARRIARIEDVAQQCRKQGMTGTMTKLMKTVEDINRQRRVLQEVILSLERIARIYNQCEEMITDKIEGNGSRDARTVSWTDITFSSETMVLINQISA